MKLVKTYSIIKNCIEGDYSYIRQKSKLKNFPRLFAIELTNHCNLKCVMCPLPNQMKRTKGFMELSLFKKIVDEISPYTDFIWLHNFGEPLLHPKVCEFIEYCNEKGIKAGLSTNVTLLTPERSIKLLKAKLFSIILSLDGVTKETYEKIRKGSNYDTTIKNVTTFLESKKLMKSNIRTSIQLIKMNVNEEEIDKFISNWKNYDVEIIIKNFDTWAGTLKESESISIEKNWFGCNNGIRYPCKMMWHRLIILWDGTVVLCEKDYDAKVSIANIKNESLFDIWNGKKMIELREQQIQNNFNNGLCNKCKEYEGFPSNEKFPLLKKSDARQVIYRMIPFKYTPSNIFQNIKRIWKNK